MFNPLRSVDKSNISWFNKNMQKICKITGKPFLITEKEIDFCKHWSLPLPEISPKERLRALMATRNEWKLYHRKCDATGDEILSAYAQDSPFTVYKNEFWWGDKWNALDYSMDFDFNRTFFEQFEQLQKAVPREGTSVFNCENCEYNSHTRESRNCYLNSLVHACEDLYYSYWMVNDKNVFDSMYTNDCTLCYRCNEVNNSYECIMLEESNNCSECLFSFQLRGCQNCIFCTNLANKKYHIYNKPVSKEKFEEKKKEILKGSWELWEKTKKEYLEIRKNAAHRYVHNLNCENVSGDHLYDCRNCIECYESFESEDGYNSISLSGSKDVFNCYSAGWQGCEVAYNCAVSRGSKEIAFCTYTWYSNNLFYCDSCNASSYCFGCIGLQHKKYCILNKQYSKEEYHKLLPKVIAHMAQTGEWGNIFPPGLSPFAYNETAAQNFFPLDEHEAIALGYKWREKDQKEYQPPTTKKIPDNIQDITDNFIKEILACENCSKNYRIIKKELEFYRKFLLPVPRHCPSCRHTTHFQMRNRLELFDRTCTKCQKQIQSSYASYRPEEIYCEKCYLKSIS